MLLTCISSIPATASFAPRCAPRPGDPLPDLAPHLLFRLCVSQTTCGFVADRVPGLGTPDHFSDHFQISFVAWNMMLTVFDLSGHCTRAWHPWGTFFFQRVRGACPNSHLLVSSVVAILLPLPRRKGIRYRHWRTSTTASGKFDLAVLQPLCSLISTGADREGRCIRRRACRPRRRRGQSRRQHTCNYGKCGARTREGSTCTSRRELIGPDDCITRL